ncbi:hypothetical protein [Thalassotalea fusca]
MQQDYSQLWKQVERDKIKYKVFLLVSLVAWGVAIGVLAYIGYLFYLDYIHINNLFEVGAAKQFDVHEAKKNIYTVVLTISIIVACLASLVVLMRQRSCALHDIQVRLAIVEQHISESNDKA